MSDIVVEEEVIVIDIESDIADNSNINAVPRAGACGDPLDGNGNDDAVVGGRKRGRQGSDLWSLYTDDVNPHQHKSAVYKHCRMLVNHHKKSESVKVHLNKCAPFRKLMNGMEEDKRPAWYTANKKPRTPLSTTVSVLKSSVAPSSSRQRSIKEFTILVVSKQQKVQFQKHIAMHYYAIGSSFQRVKDVHQIVAIKTLRPDDGLLPNRRQMATSLLDTCHEDVKTKVVKGMIGATSCLINVNNDAIINYMAASPKFAMFLESVSTGQQGQDHKFIADDIERVIREHPSTIFAGAVTDNTSMNKKAWGLLHITFPSCYFQGCCSHGLHLFVKDVFAATKTKKAGQVEATYPDQYLFELMLEFIAYCKDVIKYFHNHHVAKAHLRDLQLSAGARTLVRAILTRWGTIQAMCQTLLESEQHLHVIVTVRDFVQGTSAQKSERSKIKKIVTNDAFVNNLHKALTILAPIDILIVKYQSDKVPISKVMLDFHNLLEEYKKVMSNNIITHQEFKYLVVLAQ
jgi:hypothetical protein